MILLNKAVFLDRDGVINFDISDYTYRIGDFKLIDGITDALKIFLEKGFLLIIITNQGGIAKNIYGHKEVNQIHEHLSDIFLKEKIVLTNIYYCPHHPVSGNCLCRKPESLLLEKAIARYHIDPSRSYFIGDHDRDVEAGNKAGVHAIKIETNSPVLEIVHRIK